MSQQIKNLVEGMLQPYLDSIQAELVDIEYVKEGKNWFLRVFVDKENGIDIDDCGRISEYLSEKLDEKDPIPEAYFLEVSSPGAERPLKKLQDYERAVGKHVHLETTEPVNGWTELEGKLLSFDGETLEVQVGKKQYQVKLAIVESARLAIVF